MKYLKYASEYLLIMLALLAINKYLKVIMQCVEPKIFNGKVMVLFYKIKNSNQKTTFSLNIFDSTHPIPSQVLTYYKC